MAESKLKSKKKCELIYVIAGEEESLLNIECEKLLNQLLEPQQRATGLFHAEAATASASEILDELRTLPFLTEKRVVVIKGADKFVSQNRRIFEKYFDNPCPTGILVLTVTNWDARTRLAKKLTAVGKLINAVQPKRWELPPRLIKYAADAHGKNLTREAAELLIELAGDELARLYSEIDKLAVFACSEKSITVQHVEPLIGHNRLFNAFTVIDAVIAGNAAQAVERLRNMFAEDRTAQFSVVGAFAFHFRRMFNAKVLLEKGVNTTEIAKRLRIWRDRDGFFAQLRKVTLEQIGSILQKLAAIDYAIKTGRTKAEVATEQLVLKLASG
jgi:DNA polymerase-3 subunit delta